MTKCSSFHKDFIYLFLERGEGREKERETNINMCGRLSHAPYWGPGPQLRPMPWVGIEPVTLSFRGRHSVHWFTPAGAQVFLIKISYCVLAIFILFIIDWLIDLYCYSIPVVCIVSPSLHPTPAKPTSLPRLHPPPIFIFRNWGLNLLFTLTDLSEWVKNRLTKTVERNETRSENEKTLRRAFLLCHSILSVHCSSDFGLKCIFLRIKTAFLLPGSMLLLWKTIVMS